MRIKRELGLRLLQQEPSLALSSDEILSTAHHGRCCFSKSIGKLRHGLLKTLILSGPVHIGIGMSSA